MKPLYITIYAMLVDKRYFYVAEHNTITPRDFTLYTAEEIGQILGGN